MIRKFTAPTLLTLLLLLTFSRPVHAYIDPATTSYLIQIVWALLITLGVTVGVFFNRIRALFLNLRVNLTSWGIRTFSKKGRGQFDRTGSRPHDSAMGQANYPKRLLASLPTSLCLSFSFFVFGIYELYATNLNDFSFPLNSLLPLLILLALAAALTLALLLSLLPGRFLVRALSLLLGVSLGALLQAGLLNRSLGPLTGDPMAWETLSGTMLLNTGLWLLITGFPLILGFLAKKAWRILVLLLPLALLVTQFFSSISLYAGNPQLRDKSSGVYLSSDGILQVAKDDNIIVLVLDRLDNDYIDQVLLDDPRFLDGLDGFTRFTNNTSRYSQTFPSVTEMLTGIGFDYKEGYSPYLKRAWKEGALIPRLADAGFEPYLFMTPTQSYDSAGDLAPLAKNLAAGKLQINRAAALASLCRLSAYRYAPLAMKPFFWLSTSAFDSLVKDDLDPPPYALDDAGFYGNLLNRGLEVTAGQKRLTFIHMNGPHPPYRLDEYGQSVQAGSSSLLQQTKGSLRIVFEYLDQLKAMGQYESATLIITGDHGARTSDTKPLNRPIVTALFVKPQGQAGSPLAQNNAPVSTDNLRPTLYQAAGLDYKIFGPTYFDVPEHARLDRMLYHRLYASEGGPDRVQIYRITGDAKDFENWTLMGEEIIG